MQQTLQLQSPAKLNLMLHITGRRENGYHNLQTVFQFIQLYDELSFVKTAHSIRRICGNEGVDPQQDLIVRAAQLLQRYSATRQGVDISIEKIFRWVEGWAAAVRMQPPLLWHSTNCGNWD